jgi:hypothetical protein
MMMEILSWTLIIFPALISSFFFHEGGHKFAIQKLTGRKQKFRVRYDCSNMNEKDFSTVLYTGIISGLIPIYIIILVVATIHIPSYQQIIIMAIILILYFEGCRPDIKKLKRMKQNGS